MSFKQNRAVKELGLVSALSTLALSISKVMGDRRN